MSELIDRKALERIVRRAAELQAGSQEIGEGLTSQEVLALGKDVGIPEGYLRQAMLEEQTRAGTPESAAGTWALSRIGRCAIRRARRGKGRRNNWCSGPRSQPAPDSLNG